MARKNVEVAVREACTMDFGGYPERNSSKLAHLILERIRQDCIACGPFGVVMEATSDISRTEQFSLCFSLVADGVKKEAFVGFYETKTTYGKALYDLITKAISDLNLDLTNIVGECFDGAANMSGKEKGLAARMKDCSPSVAAPRGGLGETSPLHFSPRPIF